MSSENVRKKLLERELARVMKTLVAEYEPKAVYLYGSLVSGHVSEWSDLDLVVIKETNETFYDRIASVLKLTQPKVGIDICVYTPQEWQKLVEERRFVKEEIIEHGRLMYAA